MVLPSASRPMTRSPTLSGAVISARSVVPWVTRRGSVATSLTISPMPLAAIAPTMPTPRRKPVRRGSSSPNPATVVNSPSSSSSITAPSVATMRWRASRRVSAATRSTSSSAASFSEKL